MKSTASATRRGTRPRPAIVGSSPKSRRGDCPIDLPVLIENAKSNTMGDGCVNIHHPQSYPTSQESSMSPDLIYLAASGQFVCLFPYRGYGICRDGTVWSCRRSGTGVLDQLSERWKQRIPTVTASGYLQVCLRAPDGRFHTLLVHDLLLKAFVGPCPSGHECCHNNGNPGDNRLENLRWDTRQENVLDQLRHGRKPINENHPDVKISDAQLREILGRAADGESLTKLSREFGVSIGTISRYVSGTRRRHRDHL